MSCLTNGDTTINGGNGTNNTGSVVSTTPFPTGQGVQVTFATVTYGGNGYRNSAGQASGADGLAFFLMDGSKTPSIGAFGGSLGYSCSQGKNPADGVNGGYVGVAIDEFGNFSNPGDATSDGPGSTPNAIVVRGAGSITYAALNAAYPAYYPANLSSGNRLTAVQNTCRTGKLQYWGSLPAIDHNGQLLLPSGSTSENVNDYNIVAGPLKLSTPIYNQQGIAKPLRSNANVFTYSLSITQDNLLSLSYNINGGASTPVISAKSITAGNGPLPASFLFGFTSGTGGGSNVHEILCFKAAQINAAANSAGTNAQQAGRVQAGSQVYLAYYHPLNDWGQLAASNLLTDASGNVAISSSANWDASCVLSGGACSATGSSQGAQTPASRTILSWDGSQGIAFQYNRLSALQKLALGDPADGAARLAYLRGERSLEITSSGSGSYRRRDSVLGDIINSSPTWVGYPTLPYNTAGRDLLRAETIAEFGASYSSFTSASQQRANVVYLGANDGMLHGFRAGGYDASATYSTATTPNDGKEILAYLPGAVASTIHSLQPALDYSSSLYAHNSFVDATPATGDLYYKGAWHTWLVSGLGPGGNAGGTINNNTSTGTGALFALDITDPAQFAEANAASLVINEWTSNNLACVNAALCRNSFGNQFGTPIIRLLHDGNWAVIFGNGRNSATGTAGIFIMTVNRKTGAQTLRFLDTGVKSLSSKNAIDQVASGDLDNDHVTDYIYAGDTLGNIWRFDLTSSDPAKWAAGSAPLFTTDGAQPVTTRLLVNAVLTGSGAPRVILSFGTGRQTPQTLTSAATYDAGTHSLYGIWDWDMSDWNAKSSTQYAVLAAPQAYNASNLQQQTATTYSGGSGTISGYRTVSSNPVCWKGSSSCPANNNKYGYQLVLPGALEQILYNPVAAYGNMLINTTIPTVTQALSCSAQPASGYTMAISLATGGAQTVSLFNSASINAGIAAPAPGVVSGIGLSATGSPAIVTSNGKPYMVQQTVSGVGVVTQLDPTNTVGKRLTWSKLR
ncbi:MAG: pilus assembly protein [Janthinobacterium lividum]